MRPKGQDTYPGLHQPNFDFHDDTIAFGVAMHVEIARRFWHEGFDPLAA
jgi:metal-dependent amidase/aminoacylase/carboxypeptidase family protein